MLTAALFLLGLAIVAFIFTLLWPRTNKTHCKTETDIIGASLTPAPDLCTWISKELDHGKVTFSLHTYGNLEGSNIFGSFNVYKDWPAELMAQQLKRKSSEIVKKYNDAYIISQANWNGPQQLDC